MKKSLKNKKCYYLVHDIFHKRIHGAYLTKTGYLHWLTIYNNGGWFFNGNALDDMNRIKETYKLIIKNYKE